MALIRVAQYSSTPTVVGDYQAQNAHLQAFTNQLMTQQFILDSGTAQPVIKQGCYVSHGGSLYVADADTAITGSPADGSVYIRVSGTTSLTVEFVTDISGYTWNPVYTALTSGSYTILPYLIVKAGTSWTRYNFNPNNQQFDGIGVSNFYHPEYIIYDGSKSNTDFKVINSQAGSYSIGSITGDNAVITTSTYVKKREIESKATGTVRVSHYVRTADNRTAYTRVYVNGVAVGIEHQLVASNSSVVFQTFTDDIVVEYGDLVQIYGKVSVPDATETYVAQTYIMCNIRPSLQ